MRRSLGLERNELRRPVDRVQRSVALGLLLLLVVLAPPVAVRCAGWAHDSGVRAERAEHASRHQVVATVVATGGIGSSGDRYVHETVQATWPRPGQGGDAQGGQGRNVRTGTLPSWKDAEVGSKKRIWVDREGAPAVRPRPHSRTVTDAVYAAAASGLGVGLPLLVAYLLVRRRCDLHRYRLWDSAWDRMDAGHGHNHPF